MVLGPFTVFLVWMIEGWTYCQNGVYVPKYNEALQTYLLQVIVYFLWIAVILMYVNAYSEMTEYQKGEKMGRIYVIQIVFIILIRCYVIGTRYAVMNNRERFLWRNYLMKPDDIRSALLIGNFPFRLD